MTEPHRLVLDAVDGRLVVRDRTRPWARLVTLTLPRGRRAQVAAHLCGWIEGTALTALWATPDDAVAALADEDGWAGVLEAAAALMAPPPRAPLPAGEEERLAALCAAHPGLWVDGPHPHPDGGWYVVLSGASELGWALGRGDTPQAAARHALAQAEAA